MSVIHPKVIRLLLLSFLEDLVCVEWNLTFRVLQTPATEPCWMAVGIVCFHTTIDVNDVLLCKYIIIRNRKTGVPTERAIVCSLIDTAIRKNRNRQVVDVIRVFVQEWVSLANGWCTHLTISKRLIWIIKDIMLLRCSSWLHSSQESELQLARRLIINATRDTEVVHSQVHIVILKLTEDIKRCITTCVESVWIQCTGCIQRIRIRVDVEVTLYCSCYRISIWTQRSRSFLLTIRGVANEIDRELLTYIMCKVEVCGVTLNPTVKRPSWVEHCWQRTIVLALIRTTGHTYRVIVHDGIREEFVKPVRIAVLCITKIRQFSFWGIRKSELPLIWVVLSYQLIHLSVDTAIGCISRLCIVKIALLLQFLIDRHLVLRVHYVEIAVTWLQSQGVFSSVIDVCLTCTTFLCRYNNHTRHRARTIYRGGRTVLQDLKTLYIVRVQTRNSWRDKGVSITRREFISRYIDHIFHDNTVYHP